MGADALRAPAGPLPADPSDDGDLPPELLALKTEADRQLMEWLTTGHGLASSSLYDAVAFFSTGLGDAHTHDGQIGFIPTGYNADLFQRCLHIDPEEMFDDAERGRWGRRPNRSSCWPIPSSRTVRARS